jgi:hypothetical protein
MRKTAAAMAAFLTTTACAHTELDAAMLRKGSAVTPVFTEHSAGLRCLGGLIDQSGAAPIDVLVRDIDDATVPRFNEERRLSLGGSFVLHTALSRLESQKVAGTLDGDARGPRVLVLSGAWTQDDQRASDGGVGVRARAGNVSARIGARSSSDFIAGDFASSIGDRVLLSTAVGVALSRSGQDATLIVDDGREGAEVGLDRRSVQGAQMAQRRILEAVAIVHLANFFKLDYRACLEASYAAPDAFIGALEGYAKMSAVERIKAVQRELARTGHLKGAADGKWTEASRAALSAFQVERKLPVTGRASGVLFAFLATAPTAPAVAPAPAKPAAAAKPAVEAKPAAETPSRKSAAAAPTAAVKSAKPATPAPAAPPRPKSER